MKMFHSVTSWRYFTVLHHIDISKCYIMKIFQCYIIEIFHNDLYNNLGNYP